MTSNVCYRKTCTEWEGGPGQEVEKKPVPEHTTHAPARFSTAISAEAHSKENPGVTLGQSLETQQVIFVCVKF